MHGLEHVSSGSFTYLPNDYLITNEHLIDWSTWDVLILPAYLITSEHLIDKAYQVV